ncbi:MAG: hypothetical protein QOE32_3404 [Pseudonocardiales bacterium]|jgi:hypothetical protein|nr:hypothetical protein [Pseudonocardiales bacterium]
MQGRREADPAAQSASSVAARAALPSEVGIVFEPAVRVIAALKSGTVRWVTAAAQRRDRGAVGRQGVSARVWRSSPTELITPMSVDGDLPWWSAAAGTAAWGATRGTGVSS